MSSTPEAEPAGLPAPTELERKLERALEPHIQPGRRPEVQRIVQQVVEQELFVGPLPHPEHLEQYERTLPGAANRILAMAEAEQRHRHGWENRSLEIESASQNVGLFFGFIIAIGLVVGAVVCAYLRQPAIGIALVAAAAVSMVPALIKGRELLSLRGRGSPQTPSPKPAGRTGKGGKSNKK